MKVAYFTAFLILIALFGSPRNGRADVAIPWSTSFSCPDWKQGESLNCDGIVNYGDWQCSGSGEAVSTINPAGNSPAGGGGSGWRTAVGDGVNNSAASFSVTFTALQPELWIRFYIRFPQGFRWSSLDYHKLLYLYTDRETSAGTQAIPEFGDGADDLRIYAQSAGGTYGCEGSCGWNSMMGGPAGDGKWHFIEFHVKMDTNGSDGVAQAWIDGVERFAITNANFSNGTRRGWQWFQINANQKSPDNGGCVFVDYDDVAVSNTGYIGPVGGTQAALPASTPTN
jgi:hypothetical protein